MLRVVRGNLNTDGRKSLYETLDEKDVIDFSKISIHAKT